MEVRKILGKVTVGATDQAIAKLAGNRFAAGYLHTGRKPWETGSTSLESAMDYWFDYS